MRCYTAVAALAAACAFASVEAAAQTTSAAERVTLQQWGQRVGDALNHTMRYPLAIGDRPLDTGIVRVKFNCSDSGQPDKVTLLKGSGSRALDKAAVLAVQKIATLHPLPDGMSHDQQFAAVLIFETDSDRYDAEVKQVRAEALKSNAWFKGPSMATAQAGPILIAAR